MADPREEFFASVLDARPVGMVEQLQLGMAGRLGQLWMLEDGSVIDGEELIQRGVRRFAGGGSVGDKWDRVVRFRAWVEGRSPSDVARDPRFLDDWQAITEASLFPPGQRRQATANAWDEVGVLTQRADGSWRYSDEYVSWLLTEYLFT